jgi:glycosyltransferase involved in cell wall biosynthesis
MDTDVLYLRIEPTRSFQWALSRLAVPKILEINGSDILPDPRFSAFARTMDLILVDSEPLRDQCIGVTHLPPSKVAVHLSPAFDEAELHQVDQSVARRRLGVHQRDRLVVHVSGFQPHHDFLTIERAFRNLYARGEPHCPRLVLIGDGPSWARESARFADLVHAGIVYMPGYLPLDRVQDYLAAADVCINLFTASRLVDGNLRAFKLYQYIGCGCPTIEAVDDSLPIDDWAREALCLIPPGSAEALVQAIRNVLDDAPSWQSRAMRGREYMLEHRTWRAAAESTLSHLDRVLTASQL